MNSKEKSIDSKEELQNCNARRIDQLVDVVERHTRTERHLEQNLDISSPEDVSHALEIQRDREQEIDNLKNIIAYGEHEKNDELKNLTRNYAFTDNYLENNSETLDDKTLARTKEKQENRKDQIGNITHTKLD